MNRRSNVTQRFEEEIACAGAPLHGDQVPPLEEDGKMELEPASPPPLKDENIRTSFLQTAQVITTQAQGATAQAQAMTSQANREVVPHPHEQVSTMASHLRYFNRMNLLLFTILCLKKNPKNSSIKSIRNYYLWGYPQVKWPSWPCINSRTWLKHGLCNGEIT